MARKKKVQFDNGKPKKNPNDRIVLKVNYYDADGKRRGKTFTGYDDAEVAIKRAEWELNRSKEKRPSMTVLKAVEGYISLKESVLSPSTVKAYESIKKHNIEKRSIGGIPLKELDLQKTQAWITEMVKEGLSPKTIRNCFALVQAAMLIYDKSMVLDVTLPAPKKYQNYTPSDKDVKALIKAIRAKGDRDLLIAVLLAAFGPLRRGEICALTSDDIHGNVITVSKDVVLNKDGVWVTKQPKTFSSAREIEFPDFVIEELKGIQGPLIQCNPNVLHDRFRKLIRKNDLPLFRFHDLRHYGASIMHAIGVPDVYIIKRGGWATDHVMKTVYRDAIDDVEKKQTKNINKHFQKVIM